MIFVLFGPNPKAKSDEAIRGVLLNRYHEVLDKGPLWLHQVLLSAHLPAWRQYIYVQEEKFRPLVCNSQTNNAPFPSLNNNIHVGIISPWVKG